jgi:hypothetical protein
MPDAVTPTVPAAYQARGIAAADGANQPDEQPRQRPRRRHHEPERCWHPRAGLDGLGLERANLAMDFQVRLVIGATDDVRNRGVSSAQLAPDRQEDVDVIKDDKVLTAFRICLHRLVLIHGVPKAKRQVAGKRQCLAGLRLMLLDGLADTGHIYLQQCVDAVLQPIQVEVIVGVAACRWDLYDAIGEGVFGI